MKDLFTVIKFTIKDMISRKTFIITTLIICIMIIIGFNVPNILDAVLGEEYTSTAKILVVDEDNMLNENISFLELMDLGYIVMTKNGSIEFEEIKNQIDEGIIDEAIVISKNDDTYNISYIVQSINEFTIVPENILNAINSIYSNNKLLELGISNEDITNLNPNFQIEIEQTEEKEVSGSNFLTMIFSLILFLAIYFSVYQVSSSITTEKTSKIIETLVTSTTPKTIVIGKTLGVGIVGLGQMLIFAIIGVISAKLFFDSSLINSVLDVSNITITLAVILFVYFILGYFTYAFLYAITGSFVSKPEEAQIVNTPVNLITVISFYLSYFTMMTPNSKLNEFAANFPLSSPFSMPFRYMLGLASLSEVLISVLILLITMFIISRISIKIYSSAILNTGAKLSFKSLLSMFKDKENR